MKQGIYLIRIQFLYTLKELYLIQGWLHRWWRKNLKFSSRVVCPPVGNSLRKTDLPTDISSALAQHQCWGCRHCWKLSMKNNFPFRIHHTMYLNTGLSSVCKILLQITRSRCCLIRTWSFSLLESWLYARSRSGLEFLGSWDDRSVVFQLTW